jgi:hypothetical protein
MDYDRSNYFWRGPHCGLGVLSGIWTSQASALGQQEVQQSQAIRDFKQISQALSSRSEALP